LKSLGVHYSDDVFAPPRSVGPHDRHMSQDLKTCTGKLVLSLEDDAPIEGARAVFLIDIMNPCWMLPAVELSPTSRLTVAVGQVPFNFQIGKDIEAIKLNAPRIAAGELEVRLDSCDGDPVALLPPIAVLPIAGLLLRLGQPDLLDSASVAAAGAAIFSNLGLLFAIGVAVGLARENHGAAGLASVVAYLVATRGAEVLIAVP